MVYFFVILVDFALETVAKSLSNKCSIQEKDLSRGYTFVHIFKHVVKVMPARYGQVRRLNPV